MGLPQPFAKWMLLAQGLFYLAAILDPWIPEKFFLKTLTAPISTFVTLMVATLCAVSICVVPADKLWVPTAMSRG